MASISDLINNIHSSIQKEFDKPKHFDTDNSINNRLSAKDYDGTSSENQVEDSNNKDIPFTFESENKGNPKYLNEYVEMERKSWRTIERKVNLTINNLLVSGGKALLGKT